MISFSLGRSNRNNELDIIIDSMISSDSSYTSVKALRSSDVWTAVSRIASDVAASDLMFYRNGEQISDNAMLRLINIRPNDMMSAYHFKFALIANLLLTGNSYAIIKRNALNDPVELTFAPPSSIEIELDEFTIEYRYTDSKNRVYAVDSNDIIHLKYMTTDGLYGISPLEALKDELDMVRNGNKTFVDFFKRGINSSGVLKVRKGQLNADAKRKIREEFQKANAGEENRLSTIVLDDTMDYAPIEISTDVLKLVNSNLYSTKQIAKVFGIPLEKFGMELVNTSSAEANDLYIKDTLSHYMKIFESELSLKVGSGYESFKFDLGRLTALTLDKQIEVYSGAVKSSIMTINEARKEMGKPPVANGDIIFINQAFANLDAVAKGEVDYNVKTNIGD